MSRAHLYSILPFLVASTALAQSRPIDKQPAPTALSAQASGKKPNLVPGFAQLPMRFEANVGQADKRVQYLARGKGYTLFLTSERAIFSLRGASPRNGAGSIDGDSPRSAALQISLLGANFGVPVNGEKQLWGWSNYLIGRDHTRWRTHINNYAQVRYRDVYPGVDMVYSGDQGQVEFSFIVARGADPHRIRFVVEGANEMRVDHGGDLLLRYEGGETTLRRPRMYQRIGGRETEIEGGYVVSKQQVSFKLAAYDKNQPLIIDPVLNYSTFLGGSGADQANAVAVDSAGNAYIAGSTQSLDFPVSGSLQPANAGGWDAFITQISPDGSSFIYSTYLGGSGDDQATSIAIDGGGNAYFAGRTTSADFPITNGAFQSQLRGATAAFIAKLAPGGSGLLYSTYLGGSNNDQANAIAIDPLGNIVVAGQVHSPDFPTTAGAFQTACHLDTQNNCADAFVARINPEGTGSTDLVYSTYLGGSAQDQASGVATDGLGQIEVTGQTQSLDFPPTPGALQIACHLDNEGNCSDAFVTKINPAGNGPGDLVYSTYFGGSGNDLANGMAVDAAGTIYIAGATQSADLATSGGAFQPACHLDSQDNCANAFVTRISPGGQGPADLIYSTYLGGSGADQANRISVDANGNTYIVGTTTSTDFPTASSVQNRLAGGSDAFLAKLNAQASALIFSTYLGGSGSDQGTSLGLDSLGNAYVAGTTLSADFPTLNALQPACASCGNGIPDAFVAKLSGLALPVVTLSAVALNFDPQLVGTSSNPQTVSITNNGDAWLNIASIIASGDYTQSNNCGTSVAPGGNCIISVTFTPAGTGSRVGAITVTDDAAGSPQTINLTGTGIAPAVNLSPTSLSFGSQLVGTASSAQNVTLTNVGTASLTIQNISVSGDFSQSNNCPASLGAGSYCVISVIFTPTMLGGRGGTLLVADNAADSPQAVTLTGIGVAPAVNFTPPSLNFSQQVVGTSSPPQVVTLTNVGTAPLTISNVLATGDYSQTNNCIGALQPNASCNIQVTFTPTVTGSRPGSIVVTDNASDSPQSVALSGTGINPTVSLSPTSLSFGNQLVGTSSNPKSVVLTNTGVGNLLIAGISITGDFTQTNNCPASLASSSKCTISVKFTPTAQGTRAGTAVITDNAKNSPQQVKLSGTGTITTCPPNQWCEIYGSSVLSNDGYNNIFFSHDTGQFYLYADDTSCPTCTPSISGNGPEGNAFWSYALRSAPSTGNPWQEVSRCGDNKNTEVRQMFFVLAQSIGTADSSAVFGVSQTGTGKLNSANVIPQSCAGAPGNLCTWWVSDEAMAYTTCDELTPTYTPNSCGVGTTTFRLNGLTRGLRTAAGWQGGNGLGVQHCGGKGCGPTNTGEAANLACPSPSLAGSQTTDHPPSRHSVAAPTYDRSRGVIWVSWGFQENWSFQDTWFLCVFQTSFCTPSLMAAGWQRLPLLSAGGPNGNAPPLNYQENAVIYDPDNDVLFAFGGLHSGSTADQFVFCLSASSTAYLGSGKTCSSNFQKWVKVTPHDGFPGVRDGIRMVWDPVNHRILVMGGMVCSSCTDPVTQQTKTSVYTNTVAIFNDSTGDWCTSDATVPWPTGFTRPKNAASCASWTGSPWPAINGPVPPVGLQNRWPAWAYDMHRSKATYYDGNVYQYDAAQNSWQQYILPGPPPAITNQQPHTSWAYDDIHDAFVWVEGGSSSQLWQLPGIAINP